METATGILRLINMAAIGYIDNVGMNTGANYISYSSAIVVSFYPTAPVIIGLEQHIITADLGIAV